ncbi:GGDEF domain-containing protein [Erwinia psidii]|uniref:diguanylate cyclase n=1 Tax=Erwinia psidii TaxID=69224 RepID=A0A3N6ULU1_9GAMM|nr:diguanylate cyclase [Erwinia psidii]MCX8959426.1 diguanylate cyclase [Erwinia psidii]MCX8962682.1 diguanylate cyclase [Erwinia psidii]MCX8964278.1 diguanylate cyclase [Erwinia psidii]RQM36889.1 diguanylate cyclase [Erwinia psidii]
MKLQSYDELLNSRHRLSLMLFLFLNAATSLFFISSSAKKIAFSYIAPAVILAMFSSTLLLWFFLRLKGEFPILNIVSLFTGLLWAWQIVARYQLVFYFDSSFLLLSLIGVIFISVIALGNHVLASCLHTVPSAVAVLLLDQGQNTLIILFSVALPLIGVTLHQLMQRRGDIFTRRLVHELYEEKEKYSGLSMLDPLTGLYNRRGLKNRLENLSDTGNNFVLLLDIDHFKAYNDNYGHAMGDQALARVSTAIRDAVRSRDVVTRYGGEEFLVLMTNINESIAHKLAERIRQCVLDLEIPHRFNDQVATHVTISAGYAPMNTTDFESALANADRALYLAKDQGRNAILSYRDIAKNAAVQPADAV